MENSSFSETVTNFIKWHHEWTIQSFCLHVNEDYLRSGTFTITGYENRKWNLGLRPRPKSAERADYVSVYLETASDGLEKVTALVRFSMLNHKRNVVRAVTPSVTRRFSQTRRWMKFAKFMHRRDLLDHLDTLASDDLIVRCEIWVRVDPVTATVPRNNVPLPLRRSEHVRAETPEARNAELRVVPVATKESGTPSNTRSSLSANEQFARMGSLPSSKGTFESTKKMSNIDGVFSGMSGQGVSADDNVSNQASRSKKLPIKVSDMEIDLPEPSPPLISVSTEQLSSSERTSDPALSTATRTATPGNATKRHRCYLCSEEFPTRTKLNSHIGSKHGVLNVEMYNVVDKIAEYRRKCPSITRT